jgi:3-hydroxyisobutyrate dehydrogenase-like beta-hydroxyacid dehydrogenase
MPSAIRDMRTAAFAGLGQMGLAMAARVQGAGLDVVGIDPDPHARAAAVEQGLSTAGSLGEAAADAVFLCVPGPREVTALVSECTTAARAPRVVVNLSTIGPTVAERQRERLGAATPPIAYVEAPISGGVLRAAQGRATLLCAAEPPQALETIAPILERIAEQVIRFPTIRACSTAKLVNNLAVLATSLATAEALEWGIREGLDAGQLFDALQAGTADSYALRSTLTRSLREGDFERGFAMRLALKDVRLALREAAACEHAMPFAAEVERQLAAGCEQGLGDRTFPALAAEREPWSAGRHALAGGVR